MKQNYKPLLIASIVLLVIFASLLPAVSANSSIQVKIKNKNVQLQIDNCSLLRIPSKEVYSYQPVLILAKVPGNHSVSLYVNITLSVEINHQVYPTPLPPYVIPMVPLPMNNGWYISSIPGLPASYKNGLLTSWNITSEVNYTLQVDNQNISSCSGNYTVYPRNYTNKLPPIVYTMPYEVYENNDINTLNETFGLGPKGWSVNDSKNYKALIIAIDSNGFQSVSNLTFSYRVNKGSWNDSEVTEASIMGPMENAIGDLNQLIQYINKSLPSGYQLPYVKTPIMIGTASIPAQKAGSYVEYIANATSNNETGHSPYGFYYVYSSTSTTNILIIDPNLPLWVIQQSTPLLKEALDNYINYTIPSDLISNVSSMKNYSYLLSTHHHIPFRFWNYLGSNYNIYITRVSPYIPSILNSTHPKVIILSDLWSGLQTNQTENQPHKDLWDWDLMDTKVNNKTLFTHLKNYIKTNHVGLIVTGGTLSDEVLWLSSSEKIKIGPRGHVGDNLTDININDEQTVASMLGMSLLPLWEYIRDKIANELLEDKDTYYLGLLVGSIPLQVPFVPFNSTFSLTPESKYVGWNIPSNFTIDIPSFYSQYGYKAYTEVGWQLGMPSTIAYLAWQMANKTKDHAKNIYNNLTYIIQNISKKANLSKHMGNAVMKALETAISTIYNSLQNATILGSNFNLSVNLSNINNTAKARSFMINISKKAFDELLQLMPTKLVALSADHLGGIVTYDKYWDKKGYRSVYFSFDVESAEGNIAKTLLNDAVNWTQEWVYKNITTILGNLIRVPKSVSEEYNKTVNEMGGQNVTNEGLILNEEGYSLVNITSNYEGSLSVIVVHPTTDNITAKILQGSGEIISWYNVNSTITVINISASGSLVIGIQAHCNSSLNPAYVTVKETSAVPEFSNMDYSLSIVLAIGLVSILAIRKRKKGK